MVSDEAFLAFVAWVANAVVWVWLLFLIWFIRDDVRRLRRDTAAIQVSVRCRRCGARLTFVIPPPGERQRKPGGIVCPLCNECMAWSETGSNIGG